MRLSTLLHLSILAAIVSNAVYWQLGSLTSAYGISVLAGAAYMTGTLIQLDLTARIIPARAAATVLAIVMSLTNFAGSASEAFGGWLFEAAKHGTRSVQPRGRYKRCFSRELLAINAPASSRRSSVVGLADSEFPGSLVSGRRISLRIAPVWSPGAG